MGETDRRAAAGTDESVLPADHEGQHSATRPDESARAVWGGWSA